MPKCAICGGTEFYVESGFYFCQECQTQNVDIREEVLELRVDLTTRLRKIRIRQEKSSTSEPNLGWTTWEQYNFILIGMTNELIELGASLDIKMTILQLWAFYLKKVEVAFTSTTKKTVPRLARQFHKRDAEIIYGKVAQRKKNRRRASSSNNSASSLASGMMSEGSSNRDINKQKKRMVAAEYERFVQSQGSSEGDAISVMNQSLFSVQSSTGRSSVQTEEKIQFNKAAKKEFEKVKVLAGKLPRSQRAKYRKNHVTTQYKIGPQVITPMKLWGIIYLALRIHDEKIHLADMLRYGREGHLSYYRLDHLLPPEVTLTRAERNLLRHTKELTHKGMRRSIGTMAKFLDCWETKHPDMLSLIERYCLELQLPKGIIVYAERMMAMSPPKMPFEAKTPCFPNYEGRAMAFIIVVMKILFGIDGITEYDISRVVEKINRNSDAEDFSSPSLPSKIIEPCVIVHGGMGADYAVNPVFAEMVEACRISASLGYQKILNGGNAVDAVVAALSWLENDEFFNCGYGSVVNNEGYVEMDACLVNGTKHECGSVAAVRDVEHPISVARYVMENFPNAIVTGDGAMRMAKAAGINLISANSTIAPAAYFANEIKYPPVVGYFDDRPGNRDAEILKSKASFSTCAATTIGVLDSTLFSFCEWQRYIVCRRCLLANVHFPTKFKVDPDAPGNNNLYLKFLADMAAKNSDREEPEVTSYKHLIPQELANAMRKPIEKLHEAMPSVQKDVEVFKASLTPQYSYLEQLLEDPEKDLPSILRKEFYYTKIGYMTNSDVFRALGARCNINIDAADTGIHFIEKVVPTFDQTPLPTIREFNQTVTVEHSIVSKTNRKSVGRKPCEDTVEYLHWKSPGNIFVDSSKAIEYDASRKALRRHRRDTRTEQSIDFGFNEVFPSGKLFIRNDDDSDCESVCSVSVENGNAPGRNINDTNETTIDFLAKYNVTLSNFDKSRLADSMTGKPANYRLKKPKRKVMRDPATGKFVSADSAILLENAKSTTMLTRQRYKAKQCELEKLVSPVESIEKSDIHENENVENDLHSSYDFGLNDDDISILNESSCNSLDDDIENDASRTWDDTERLFRPYTDYWMYRCNFSRVKQNKFRQFENDLPENFRWLLEECASVIEMAEEDLYEEICLIEAYYADVLRAMNRPTSLNCYDNEEYRSKAYCNNVKKKW